MTSPKTLPDDDTTEDDLRQHAEPATEGSEDAVEDQPDQPREHAENPVEG